MPSAAHYRHWTEPFLAAGYARDGRGPTLFDCWGHFLWVQREQFGRELPAHATPPSLGSIAKAMPRWAGALGWSPVAEPADGDAVFMAHMKHATHIGTWASDLKSVLHCPEGGAVLHDAFHLEVAGWRARGFYRPVN